MRVCSSIGVAASGLLGCALGLAQTPDLSGNWIRQTGGGRIAFGEWEFTEAGQRAFDAYDFRIDDPAYDCIGASWTRIWLNPN
ncbi:MAG: hypothetical protein OEQ25_12750, partial [Gammaproteobacteria bacterium]|nr:hypothetical protein [Gammaproteobacteria bacterium]